MTDSRWPSWLPLRESLAPLSAYGAPQVDAEATLNTNENPFSLSPELVSAIAARISHVAANLNRYPDRDALVNSDLGWLAISTNYQELRLAASQVWVANGSNEIIQSLFLAFGDRPAIGFLPSYSMHPLIARVTSTEWVDGKRRSDFSLDIDSAITQIAQAAPALTFITTPNNPTGEAISIGDIEKIAQICSWLTRSR
jgi:histidinol-phosphate aminotransferase